MRITTKRIFRYTAICLFCLFVNAFYLKAQTESSMKDLPLYLSGSKGNLDNLVIYLSGDGGWNSFNHGMIKEFENQGYGVVALNTRKYFWDAVSPELFARDIEQISWFYLKEWKKSSLIIVGYSFGADVASFIPGRISVEMQKKIIKLVLLSPSASTDFIIRMSDMIGKSENTDRKYKVGPEIEKTDLPVICVFGKEEVMLLKTNLRKKVNLNIFEVPGDHQYNNNLTLVSKMIGM
jgi:type IV secretory pathway VirJ component